MNIIVSFRLVAVHPRSVWVAVANPLPTVFTSQRPVVFQPYYTVVSSTYYLSLGSSPTTLWSVAPTVFALGSIANGFFLFFFTEL